MISVPYESFTYMSETMYKITLVSFHNLTRILNKIDSINCETYSKSMTEDSHQPWHIHLHQSITWRWTESYHHALSVTIGEWLISESLHLWLGLTYIHIWIMYILVLCEFGDHLWKTPIQNEPRYSSPDRSRYNYIGTLSIMGRYYKAT